MNILDTVRRMARSYPGGVDAVALRLGKSPSTLEKELRGAPGYKLGAEDALEISRFCVELKTDDCLSYAQLVAMGTEATLVPLPTGAPGSVKVCMRAVSQASKEACDMLGEASASLDDDYVNDNELRRIDGACMELVTSVLTMRRVMAENNLAGPPARTA
ncbi:MULTISPECIES: phage regulatory CII family protein [unclassified Variovorax]|uniref:phage regulatory CII family protein n=1 Tax=unclassified Variovorax TaxID=663243 RepID=UPI0025765559|nr:MULTISPECIES: phage regulatory CII family protein [unclassified Variovorax]MDM0086765.1 hypothetical protein [Variovorax sp. J22G40]MDM0144979.1 hypothetical protein [Variovorax sp. J2P1-31]